MLAHEGNTDVSGKVVSQDSVIYGPLGFYRSVDNFLERLSDRKEPHQIQLPSRYDLQVLTSAWMLTLCSWMLTLPGGSAYAVVAVSLRRAVWLQLHDYPAMLKWDLNNETQGMIKCLFSQSTNHVERILLDRPFSSIDEIFMWKDQPFFEEQTLAEVLTLY